VCAMRLSAPFPGMFVPRKSARSCPALQVNPSRAVLHETKTALRIRLRRLSLVGSAPHQRATLRSKALIEAKLCSAVQAGLTQQLTMSNILKQMLSGPT
jgi:hypothetical protein